MQVLHDEPVPPSRLSPQVPRDLETICLKCLAKEPHRRYPTALALAEDLDRYLANQPIRARRTPPWELGLKWARRRPTLSSLGAVGFLIAASCSSPSGGHTPITPRTCGRSASAPSARSPKPATSS